MSSSTEVKTSPTTSPSESSPLPRSSPPLFESLLGVAGLATATTPATTPTADKSPSSAAAASLSALMLLGSISSCIDGVNVALQDEVFVPSTNLDDKCDGNNAGTANVDNDRGDEQHNWGPTHSYSSEEEFSTPPHKSKMTGIVGNILKSSLMKSPKSCATTLSKGSTSNQSSKTALTSPVTTSTTTGNSGKDRHYVSPQLAMKTGIHDRTTTMQPSVPGAIEDGSYILSSYNATSAATGTTSVIANFWHNHASPATNTSRVGGGEGMDGQTFAHPPEGGSASLIPPGPPTAADDASTPLSSPLSTSAKAAAEAIVGMISKAETFLVARTASLSSALSGGLCSPQGSSMPMGGDIGRGGDSSISFDAVGETPEEVAERRHGESNDILEATYPTTKNDKITCGQSATNCLDFEEFGFNPFQDGCDGDINRLCSSTQRNVKYVSLSPSILRSSPSTPMHPQKPEGDEIRLKASFNPVKAKRESLLDEQTKQQQAKSGDGFSGLHYWKQNCPDHGNTPQQSDGSRTPSSGLPFREVSVPMELERSVSELTMRSHGAFEMHKYTSDSRRMAYYAMGRVTANCKNKSGGGNDGNRRCYFTGLPILNGVPFYAGSVQQGPRTLVVFCLPSALDLPTIDRRHIALKAERERYLESLPNPDADLLREMSRRYRLPIAEGEMHYRVKSSVVAFTTLQTRLHQLSEEIALSHDVMEAVNGESADMLRLPNRKVFDYLKRQYCQQCSKLNSDIFDRKSWEAVMPEV